MPFDLERFVEAQEAAYEGALRELRQGRKTGHWIWFIFPQLFGLGRSEMSRRYGIESVGEARAYLDHPVLGPRLRECVSAVLATSGSTAEQIFGSLDAMKVRSSMTLFHRAAPDEPAFTEMLERWYGGVADQATDALLEPADRRPLFVSRAEFAHRVLAHQADHGLRADLSVLAQDSTDDTRG